MQKSNRTPIIVMIIIMVSLVSGCGTLGIRIGTRTNSGARSSDVQSFKFRMIGKPNDRKTYLAAQLIDGSTATDRRFDSARFDECIARIGVHGVLTALSAVI